MVFDGYPVYGEEMLVNVSPGKVPQQCPVALAFPLMYFLEN